MAFANGGSIVTSGLVLALDAADRNSYPGSGTVWSDMSGNANTGTLTNGPTFSSANGGSIMFDGTNDNISVANSNTYLSGSNFTVSTWVNIPTISTTFTRYSILNKNVYNTSGISITIGTGGSVANQIQVSTIRMSVSGNIAATPQFSLSPTVPFDTWTQYTHVLSYDNISTYLSLYINGSFRQTLTVGSGSFVSNTTSLSIGVPGAGNGSYFSGSIANYQIYNRTLSASEILQNYNAVKSRFNL